MKITQEHDRTLNLLTSSVPTQIGGWVSFNPNFCDHQPTQLDKYNGAIIQFRPEDEKCLTQWKNFKKFLISGNLLL